MNQLAMWKLKMKKLFIVFVVSVFAISASSVSFAKGRGGSSSYYPGSGSKSTSTHVRGHMRKDGTYIQGHRRTTPDRKFENNWTTKGNNNLYTGKKGSRVAGQGDR